MNKVAPDFWVSTDSLGIHQNLCLLGDGVAAYLYGLQKPEGWLKLVNSLKGCQSNVRAWNVMLDGYVGFECVDKAGILFQEMPEKDLDSWIA
ncbi:hypothetical protein QQP08_014263 [Theobroma cacao]|nr:hypothetical protein QQP08_014263 [Theobroma cacao]